MSDDLAADAATWVPPWQRPASGTAAPGAGDAERADTDLDNEVDGAEVAEVAQLGESREDSEGEFAEPAESAEPFEPEPAEPFEPAGRSEPTEAEAGADPVAGADQVGEGEPPVVGEAMPPEGELPVAGEAVPAEGEPPVAGESVPAEDLPKQWAGLAGAKWEDTGAPRAEGTEADGAAGPGEAVAGATGGRPRVRPRSGGRAAAKQPVAVAEAGQLFAVPEQRASDVDEDEPPRRVMDESELMPALEAILMVVDEPVSEITLAGVLDVPAEQVANALIDLSAAYTRDGRGFDLRRAAGGWRFYTRADYSSYVEKFVLDGQQMRLTQASLETLAVVAYKQPVTRSRVSAIRGVNCDGVMRTLITRGMVEECGTDPDSGAHLYKTTTLFLEKLGLDSVEQLPPLAPFLPDNLDEVAAGG